MKLTKANAKLIKVGDVVTFTYPSKASQTGVVYGHPTDGSGRILCNCEDGGYFGIGALMFDGEIDFEIQMEHNPVALFGMEYDFVSNHK